MSDSHIPRNTHSTPAARYPSTQYNAMLLGTIALITTGACVLLALLLHESITHNRIQAEQQQLAELIPAIESNNHRLASAFLPANSSTLHDWFYPAFLDDQPVGMIMPITTTAGYGGPIRLLIGIYHDGRLAGVRVVPPHYETPGLGDKIEASKSDWIYQFRGKSLVNTPDWGVKPDGGQFDAFTGATITPRAVVAAVYEALLYYQTHQDSLWQQARAAVQYSIQSEHPDD